MKKLFLVTLLSLGLYVSADASSLTANSPFGVVKLESANDFPPPTGDLYMPGYQTYAGHFTVGFDTGRGSGNFEFYYGDGVTMDDIISVLRSFFGI